MRFGASQFLMLVPIVALLLAAFLFWSWRVKQRLIGRFIQSRLLANLTVGVSAARQKIRLCLLVAAAALAVFTLARPQWGYLYQEAHQQGLDIVVAIDASKSMLATDIAPNRLARAKLAALDLMKLAKHDRLALVVFAGTAFLQSPLTLDEEAFRQSVNSVDPANMPRGGTDLAAAIESARDAFEKNDNNHKVLVILTDGEDHDEDARTAAAAEKAAANGMIIFTIGIGSAEGEVLPIKDGQGNYVKSRLNEALLQKIATLGHGFYLPLRGASPIETLYARGLDPLPKSDPSTKLARVYQERYHGFLALAMICLIVEMLLPERKRPPSKPASGALAAKALSIFLFALISASAHASPSGALRQYNSGKFDLAEKEYERLSKKDTNDYRLLFNAGTAAYKAKNYETAEKNLTRALESPNIWSDPAAQERALFNLGNTQVQLGQDKWPSAVTNYIRALQIDPRDAPASNNLAFVQRKMEEQKQQQQQQQQQQKNNQDQNQQQQQQQQSSGKQDPKDSQQQQQAQARQQQDKDKQEKQAAQARRAEEKEKEKQAQQAAAQPDSAKDPDQDNEPQAAQPGQMTRQEANRILDAQEADEKPLIFQPDESQKRDSQEGPVRDW